MTEEQNWPHTQAHRDKGDWNPLWEKFAELDPAFLEAYLAFRTVPQSNGPLPQKTKELITNSNQRCNHSPVCTRCQTSHSKRTKG